jgi:hypothetical protein
MASWTTPKTWVAGSALTAAEMNTHVRDNLTWLKDALSLHGIDSDSARGQLDGALYGVRALRTATQSILDGASTAVALTATDDFDSNSMHSTSVNNTRVTIPAGGDGVYLVGHGEEWAGNATGSRAGTIKLNGSTDITGTEIRVANAGGSTAVRSAAATAYQFSAADYIELYVLQNSGGSLNIQAAVLWAVRLFKT